MSKLTFLRNSLNMAASQGDDTLGDFGKFPAEIRVEIYKLCLVAKFPIKIARIYKKGPRRVLSSGVMICEPGSYITKSTICTRQGGTRGNQNRHDSVRASLAMDLLNLSKHINQEASPVLYGYNAFQFESAAAFSVFFASIGDHAPYLTDLIMRHIHERTPQQHMDLLGQLKKPKRLRLVLSSTPYFMPYRRDVCKIWNMVKPFVQHPADGSSPRLQVACASDALSGLLRRLEIINLDFANPSSLTKGARLTERGDEDQKGSAATFRKMMLEVIRKDLEEEGGHQALIPELKAEE